MAKERKKSGARTSTGSTGTHPNFPQWPYRHNPIVRLTNHRALDGQIVEVRDDYIIVREEIQPDNCFEYQVLKERIQSIEFSVYPMASSNRAQRALSLQHPKLADYEALMRYVKSTHVRRDAAKTMNETSKNATGILARIWKAVALR